jgi:hypothetical protein
MPDVGIGYKRVLRRPVMFGLVVLLIVWRIACSRMFGFIMGMVVTLLGLTFPLGFLRFCNSFILILVVIMVMIVIMSLK